MASAAKAFGAATDDAARAIAQKNFNQAANAFTMIAIDMILSACSACQKLFNSIDKALGAPPGFTQSVIVGLIGLALGMGPMGLIMAGVMFLFNALFGGGWVGYFCQAPPADVYSLPGYDSENDTYDQTKWATMKTSSDWYITQKGYVKMSDTDLWMGWARYYVGQLLEATLKYGASQADESKPRQVITYRQANVEYFASTATDTFGTIENNNTYVGLGFSQDTTKTTDWVHVSFGGSLANQ